ncbi:MAG: MFS transporter [Chloroflexi bacterium]|nr:MFS transporter [Chloroflexota bacterium]
MSSPPPRPVPLANEPTPDGAVLARTPLTGEVIREEPARRRRGLQTFSSLHYRDFRFLWLGTLCMSGGQWIQQVTLGWLVYEMTGSSVLLGALQGFRALPFLVVSPLGGVVADRVDRRRLLMGITAILATLAFGMGLLVGSGGLQVWHVFVFGLLTAVAWSFNQPVRQTLVPNVVPRSELMNAVALNSVGFQVTKVMGPAVGGVLIAAFGPHGNFFVQAGAFGAVVLAVFLMQAPPTPSEARQASVLANLKEGLAYAWRTPTVRALLIVGLVPSVFAIPYQALMPVFQKDVYHVEADGLGLMLAAPGVGAFFATFFLASVAQIIRRKGILILIALTLLGVSLILFSQAPTFPLALLALVGVGGCHILYASATTTLLQLSVPDALRGRVMSIWMLDHGLSPAGSLVAGVSTQYIGAPITVTLMGIAVIILVVAVAWGMPTIRRIEA